MVSPGRRRELNAGPDAGDYDKRCANLNRKGLTRQEEQAIEESTIESHEADGVSFTFRVGVLDV